MKGRFDLWIYAGVILVVLLNPLVVIADDPQGAGESAAKLPAVTMEEALKTATQHSPGRVVEAELEEEDNRTFYEIEIVTSSGHVQKVQVDAQSGSIIKQAREGEVAYIKLEEAIKIATEYYRWHVVDIELEEEDDGVVYEIELISRTGEEREIQVNALSGQVIESTSNDAPAGRND